MTQVADSSQFSDYLFIGIGETGAYFTLRQAWMEKTVTGFFLRSCHVRNLSQDADEALEKATKYAEAIGYKLDARKDVMVQEMRDINRMNAAQRAAREERIKAEEAQAEAAQQAWIELCKTDIANGIYPIGAHRTSRFESAPISYRDWLMKSRETFEADSVLRMMADAVYARFSDEMLPVADIDATAGDVGKRDVFDVTVVRVTGYMGAYGYVTIVIMVTDGGACMVSKGAFTAQVGNKMTIKATVKAHQRYNDQMQTVVQRVGVV